MSLINVIQVETVENHKLLRKLNINLLQLNASFISLSRKNILLTYDRKILVLKDVLTQIQFDLKYLCIYGEFTYQFNNLTFINPPDLRQLLYNVKDQFKSHPSLSLPTNPATDIWSYYKFLRIRHLL